MFFLFADLYLGFSRFMSKAWNTCKVVHSRVRGFSFQCSLSRWLRVYPVLLLCGLCEKRAYWWSITMQCVWSLARENSLFFPGCQKLSRSVSDSSRYSDFFSLRLWQTGLIKPRELGIRCFPRGKLGSPISAVNHLVTWDTLKGLSLHW